MCQYIWFAIVLFFTGTNKYLELCEQCVGPKYLDCMDEILEHKGEWTERIYEYEGNRLLQPDFHVQDLSISSGEEGPGIWGNWCRCNEINFNTCIKEESGLWECNFSQCTKRCKLSPFDKDSKAYHYDCEQAFSGSTLTRWSINDGSQCSNPYKYQMFPAIACKTMGWSNNWNVHFSDWDNCDNINGWMSYYFEQYHCDLWEHKDPEECDTCKKAEKLEGTVNAAIKIASLLKDVTGLFMKENQHKISYSQKETEKEN